ncbi:Magnesium transporter MgtE intracellular domain-containing protein, partial [Dysosmobacter welbionis]
HGGRDGQHRAQKRPGNGHLDRGPQQGQDLPEESPVRRKHLCGDVRQVVTSAPHQGQVASGEPGGSQEQQHKSGRSEAADTSLFHTAA